MSSLTTDDWVVSRLRAAWKRFPRSAPRVVDMRYQLIEDSTGKNAVRVWAILDDRTPEPRRRHEHLEPIAEAIESSIRGEGTRPEIDLIPYVYFRMKSEQDQVDAGTYDAGEY